MAAGDQPAQTDQLCRILALDGGGAKGFYTLGVLKEIEGLTQAPLGRCFDVVFGTSTGSIIAALLALGKTVGEIHGLYKAHVPSIMQPKSQSEKSRALSQAAAAVFGGQKFDEKILCHLGIVAARWQMETPMIFKSSQAQAHGRANTFVPGFGCSIADAVEASCSAYPYFQRKIVTTADGGRVELIDGGYCANNPTLYAIADALLALGRDRNSLRVVSVGVGGYPEPPKQGWAKWKHRLQTQGLGLLS